MSRLSYLLLALFSFALIFSCNTNKNNSDAVETVKIDKDLSKFVTDEGNFNVRLKTTPETIPLNEPFTAKVWIYEKGKLDTPITDLGFTLDAIMPDHNHGMLREPTVTLADDGSYLVRGMLFHMPGTWVMRLEMVRGFNKDQVEVEVIML